MQLNNTDEGNVKDLKTPHLNKKYAMIRSKQQYLL